MSTQILDPWQAATEAGERKPVYYGQMDVQAQFVKLIKGVGKQVWGPQDDPGERRTEVKLILNPLDEMNQTNLVTRDPIAESAEWAKIIWPSLKGLGLSSARDLHGKWVKAKLVESGKFTNRQGQEVTRTTLHFLTLYPDKAACVAAFHADRNHSAPAPADTDPALSVDMSSNGNGTINAERETAKAFLKPLVAQAGGDLNKLATLIAGLPMVAKHFAVTSPEVVELVTGGAA